MDEFLNGERGFEQQGGVGAAVERDTKAGEQQGEQGGQAALEAYEAAERSLFADDEGDGARYMQQGEVLQEQEGAAREEQELAQKPQNDAQRGAWEKEEETHAQSLAQGEVSRALEVFLRRQGGAEELEEGLAREQGGAGALEAVLAREQDGAGEREDLGAREQARAQSLWQERGALELAQQMEEISRLNPAIQGFGDLVGMAQFAQFDRLVMGGQDLVSAYKLANYDAMAKRDGQGRQAAMNRVRSKEHLERIPFGAAGALMCEIPENVLPLWQEMFPQENAARLRERYNAVK